MDTETRYTNTYIDNRNREKSKRGCFVWFGLIVIALLFICTIVTFLFPPASKDILIMGLDARGNEGVVSRSDTIMIINVSPTGFRVSQLSIPRDLFIDVPGYGMERINTINFLGEIDDMTTGPDLLRESIENNFGIKIDHYVRADFNAFTQLVDAVGGVDVFVEELLVDYAYPTPDGGTISIRFEPGWQTLDGERALQYVRTRHQDDDYKRAGRQQQVVAALIKKLAQPGNWGAAISILNQNLETDLSIGDILLMAPALILSGGQFEELVIDRDYILPSAGYSVPNYEKLLPWIEEHYD